MGTQRQPIGTNVFKDYPKHHITIFSIGNINEYWVEQYP